MKTLTSDLPTDVLEGADATSSGVLDRADEQGVGRMKLGRYPFEAAANDFMNGRHGTVAVSTESEERRKYRYLGKVLRELKSSGKIKSSDPRKIGRTEVQEFMAWMKDRHIDVTAQVAYLKLLNNLLRACKNYIIEEMKTDGVRFPKSGKKPIRTIAGEDLETLFETVSDMEGWRGSVSRGMLALYFATGVRPSELRLAHIEDLNMRKMTLYVRHPKGEGNWASPQEVEIIRADMVPFIEGYLKERKEWIRIHGVDKTTPLFPSLGERGDALGFYSANGFRLIKHKIEQLSGVQFKLKDFRSTLTSITVNGDLSRLPAMSAQLRHASVATTQKSYFAMERGVAGKQLRNAWKEHPIASSIKAEKGFIEQNHDYTGYV
jgi:integrase/recombinase XerD